MHSMTAGIRCSEWSGTKRLAPGEKVVHFAYRLSIQQIMSHVVWEPGVLCS